MRMYNKGQMALLIIILLVFLGIGITQKSMFMIFFCILAFIYLIIVMTSKKKYTYKLSNMTFEQEKNYFREIIKKYSIAELSYIDGFDLENPKDIIAALLKLEKENIIMIENNRIKKLDNNNLILKESEKYLLNHIEEGFLKLENDLEYIYMVEKECVEDNLIEKIPYDDVLKSVSLNTLLGKGLVRAKILDNGKEIHEKLNGLKNFLKDFSKLEDKKRKNIVLWDDYLIYSVLFGINKNIINEYKQLIKIRHYMTLNEILTIEYENSETYKNLK